MLFRFAANLSLAEIFDWQFVGAYLSACIAVYLLATLVAMVRKRSSLSCKARKAFSVSVISRLMVAAPMISPS